MPETWAVPLILLLIGVIGTLVGLLWRAKHAHDDEREKNWKQWRSELNDRLRSMDEGLDIVIALNGRMQRAETDIAEINEWKKLRANLYVEMMPYLEQRVKRLERINNGKVPP